MMINPKYIICGVLSIVVLIVGYFAFHDNHEKPTVITKEVLQNEYLLSKQLDISEKNARKIIEKIPQEKPQASFSVVSKDPNTATKQVKKMIDKNDKSLPMVVTEKTDRTVVVNNKDEQKVDVYKIDLEKHNRVYVGASVIDNNFMYSIGVQHKKWSVTVHTDDFKKINGATVMYTLYEK